MLDSGAVQGRLGRIAASVAEEGAKNQAARTMLAVASAESLEERFAGLEQSDEIEALLLELKQRQPRLE
jgi:hypothetical protein